jgi:non-canonical (house-cleaning) NTP pyrophosphatase
MHHKSKMLLAKEDLEQLGYEIDVPDMSEREDYSTFSEPKRSTVKNELIQQHLDKITTSDAILVFNEEKNGVKGYVGGNTLMEMAFAYSQKIEIFMLNSTPNLGYADEINGMLPIVLDGDIKAADTYFKALPKTFVSSKSPVKLAAISRGMRRAGIRTLVLSRPTSSNVAEQPKNIDETYAGAVNRQDALIKETKDEQPAYFATVESGLYEAHKDHNSFSSTVTILEIANGKRKIGINVELEYPKEMTDKVPSVYPDLGVLVQEEYGSALKDPFPYFTNGKINRQKLVEDAVFNVAAQL